jgi:glycosyltransferase involved in cell wall biosynthesis
MKISIVIPALNEEKLLGACVDSVNDEVARSGADCEVIVVDNGSTDSTCRVARRRGARVISEPRRGVTLARQAGLQAASGGLVANVDADGVMPAGWISTAMRELEDPAVVAVTGPQPPNDVSARVRTLALGFNAMTYATYLATGVMLQGGNAVIRRDALERIGGYDAAIDFHGEDTDTAVKLARIGRIRWTWRLSMPSSGRRLASEGAVVTGARYAGNYFSVLVRGRPMSPTHRDVR